MKLSELTIASIDTETTGVNTETDRIITLAIHRDDGYRFEWKCNPGIPIPPGATKIHGITDADVAGCPEFGYIAKDFLTDLQICHAIIGFNIYGFDLLIIMAELARAGITTPFPRPDVLIIDAGTIFKKKEPRTLEAAVQKYCGRQHEGAHGATADAVATADVLAGQLRAYPDLAEMSAEDLAKFSQHDGMVDYAGKLGLDDAGEVIYRIGKSRGTRVKDDLGMARWILDKDFPEQTKAILRTLMTEADDDVEF